MRKLLVVAVSLLSLFGSGFAYGQAAQISDEPILNPIGQAPDTDVVTQLVRNKRTLAVSGTAFGLNPNETYTIWWLVNLISDGGGTPLILNATGGLSNAKGELHFAAALQTGTYEEDDLIPRQVLVPGSLINPFLADVIFDVVAHGPPIPGEIPEQISRLESNCGAFPGGVCPLVARFLFFPEL